MLATELDRSPEKAAPGFVRVRNFEAEGAHKIDTACPFRAVCKSPRCDGNWTKPECPGDRKGS